MEGCKTVKGGWASVEQNKASIYFLNTRCSKTFVKKLISKNKKMNKTSIYFNFVYMLAKKISYFSFFYMKEKKLCYIYIYPFFIYIYNDIFFIVKKLQKKYKCVKINLQFLYTKNLIFFANLVKLDAPNIL